jgi:hypothetical protein
VLHGDIIHLKRPDGNGIDAMLHVQPDPRKSAERALLVVFNPNSGQAVNTTAKVPLYYSGLSDTARVSREGAAPVCMTLARDWSIALPLTMAPNSFSWFVFESAYNKLIDTVNHVTVVVQEKLLGRGLARVARREPVHALAGRAQPRGRGSQEKGHKQSFHEKTGTAAVLR